jgi:uncharacterized repeat protein (TIGR03803 family)
MPNTKPLTVVFAVLVVASGFLTAPPSISAADNEKVLHSFGKGEDGDGPYASLIFDAAGNLYGTTYGGGAFKSGSVFKLTPVANGKWTEDVLHSFGNGKDGTNPLSGLIFDAAGDLYGTTAGGGAHNDGTVFELMPVAEGKWTEKILHSFDLNGKDGAKPVAGMIFDTAGNLYGTTELGGKVGCEPPYGCGTVFKLAPGANGTWIHTGLYSFNGNDGAYPVAGLAFDAGGNLYGTTLKGASSYGTVFELTPSTSGTWRETVLYSFCAVSGCTDGANPEAWVILDKTGNLYGTTSGGGASCRGSGGCGTVYQLSPGIDGQWTEKVLYSFYGDADGAVPLAGLTFDGAGRLYGTTAWGAHNMGTVFRLAQVNGDWDYSVSYSFKPLKGSNPYDGVIFDAAGNLYGTTTGGGANSAGTVFEIAP